MRHRLRFVLGLAITSSLPCFALGAEGTDAEKTPDAAPADEPASGADAESQCPYDVAHDAPLEVEEQVHSEQDDHTRYRVEFNGIEGDRVPAYLYIPKPAAGEAPDVKRPAVLLQYGSGGNKNTGYIVALGEQFVSRGFVVLTIDVPQRGERRRADRRGFWESLMEGSGTFRQTMGDYSRAVDYLLTRPEVDPERVGYAGISMGAITGITFVAYDDRVKAMASIVGGGNLLGTIKGDVSPEAQAVAEEIDPYYTVKKIAPRPLLLMNATRDQLVPKFFGQSLHDAAGENATKVWVETDHFFNGVDRYEILEQVVDFMTESLPPAEEQKSE